MHPQNNCSNDDTTIAHSGAPSSALATTAVDGALVLAKRGADLLYAVPTTDRDEFWRLPFKERQTVNRLLTIFSAIALAPKREKAFRAAAMNNRVHGRGYSRQSLKRGYYAYCASGGDWRVLVNKARVPETHPVCFLEFIEGWFLRNKRGLGYRQQWFKLARFWERGCDDHGQPFRVPGYGTWQEWWQSEHQGEPLPARCPGVPRGWSYERLLEIFRNRITRAQEKMAKEGNAAARPFAPHVLGSRENLRFLELVTFDDVRVDFRVLDLVTGQPVDLWLLIAMDRATGVVLGFQMRLARERAEGSQERINVLDMKQLVAWVLWKWKLPPYVVTWLLERGTATLGPELVAGLQQFFGDRVQVQFNEMVGGKSPAGYREKAKGNSRAKASHESHNNLLHNMAGDLPGQMGSRYDVRPADLDARERETAQCMQLRTQLSDERSRQIEFPLLSAEQARKELAHIFHQMNLRTAHEMEGFDWIEEWREGAGGEWRPLAECPHPAPAAFESRKRKEMPYERMTRLTAGLEFVAAPKVSLAHFLEHTLRNVTVTERGEIETKLKGKLLTFSRPDDDATKPGTKLLAYFHPDDPHLLHLTQPPPHNGYVGTWTIRERVRHGDAEALNDALAYSRGALKAEREYVHRVCSGEAESLQAKRDHNAQLLADQAAENSAIAVQDVHAVAPVAQAVSVDQVSPVSAALSAGQQATSTNRAKRRAAAQTESARATEAREAADKRAERREAALMKAASQIAEGTYGQKA